MDRDQVTNASEERNPGLAGDRQKAKVLTFFCVLGMAGFLINLLAGVALWSHNRGTLSAAPTYDSFIAELGRRSPAGVQALATDMYEKWAACTSGAAGWSEVTTHALITASVLGAAIFALCAVLAYQVYGRLDQLQSQWAAPQPPDALETDSHVR